MRQGVTEYEKGKDKSVLEVFARADKIMYDKKSEMKS